MSTPKIKLPQSFAALTMGVFLLWVALPASRGGPWTEYTAPETIQDGQRNGILFQQKFWYYIPGDPTALDVKVKLKSNYNQEVQADIEFDLENRKKDHLSETLAPGRELEETDWMTTSKIVGARANVKVRGDNAQTSPSPTEIGANPANGFSQNNPAPAVTPIGSPSPTPVVIPGNVSGRPDIPRQMDFNPQPFKSKSGDATPTQITSRYAMTRDNDGSNGYQYEADTYSEKWSLKGGQLIRETDELQVFVPTSYKNTYRWTGQVSLPDIILPDLSALEYCNLNDRALEAVRLGLSNTKGYSLKVGLKNGIKYIVLSNGKPQRFIPEIAHM